MSRVYTDKPAKQSLYERGRRSDDSAESEEQEKESYPSHATSSSQEQGTRRSTGGYHVFPPDRHKQEKMRRIADAEEREAERLKEKRRSQLQSETRTLGGGDVSSQMARDRQEKESHKAKYARMFRQEERKRNERERIETENRKKKEDARRKAETLKTKEKQETDLRREKTRLARLERFADK